MSAVRVVLVAPKLSKSTAIARAIASLAISPLLTGWGLMLLVPLAHETVATPSALPSYWQSVALAFLLRWLVNGLRPLVPPSATEVQA